MFKNQFVFVKYFFKCNFTTLFTECFKKVSNLMIVSILKCLGMFWKFFIDTDKTITDKDTDKTITDNKADANHDIFYW